MAGVQFPLTAKGDRSTTGFNKDAFKAVAESLGCQDLAQAISSEKNWRQKYDTHIENIIENLAVMSLLDSAKMATAMQAGLDKARAMEFETSEGNSVPLTTVMAALERKFETATITGSQEAKTELTLPYHGKELKGPEIDAKCDSWATVGTMELGCAEALKSGARKLGQLKGRTFLVLGASSELGAVRPLLEAGATVAAVMRSNNKRWGELINFARGTAGTLLAPIGAGKDAGSDQEIAEAAGADLLKDAPAISEWLLRCGREASGLVTVSTYLYADGEANVRVTAAADFIAETAAKELGKDKVSFAYLASGSTSHLIPAEAIQAQEANHNSGNFWAKAVGKRRDCSPSLQGAKFWAASNPQGQAASYHFFRGVVGLQGPNYALAQYMRQWRAVLLHMQGFIVSTPVTPNCRTDSVVHNPTMKVLLEGMAYWKPMESFDPDTCRMAMFAILVADLTEPMTDLASPVQIFTQRAFHSGLWRCPFDLGSLGISTWFLGKVAPRKQPVVDAQ
mmetsp:Transcript_28717/g.72131  ORF Transcript_28717/g.72131 Transcript_28717/m.72131 type:complete len:509 (+) Transcript_28717:91-1617(+)